MKEDNEATQQWIIYYDHLLLWDRPTWQNFNKEMLTLKEHMKKMNLA